MRMVEYGAKNLAFLSRSGASSPAAKDTLKKISDQGASASVFNCNVSDEEALSHTLSQISATLPPIKGVIHLGLIIENALFKNMDIEVWRKSLLPKVRGTWNLHNKLPKDIEFFALLSSMVGVLGSASQAAYGAASSFQDAFATYRNRLGLPAITIDLGMVTGIGYVAERGNVLQNMQSQGFEEIQEDECMAILEYAITHPFRLSSAGNLMTGIGLEKFASGETSLAVYDSPQFSHFRRMAVKIEKTKGVENGSATLVRDQLRTATSIEEAIEHVEKAMLSKMATLLMIPVQDISPSKPMSHYGLDSLVAVVSTFSILFRSS
jgi:hypothetical protein